MQKTAMQTTNWKSKITGSKKRKWSYISNDIIQFSSTRRFNAIQRRNSTWLDNSSLRCSSIELSSQQRVLQAPSSAERHDIWSCGDSIESSDWIAPSDTNTFITHIFIYAFFIYLYFLIIYIYIYIYISNHTIRFNSTTQYILIKIMKIHKHMFCSILVPPKGNFDWRRGWGWGGANNPAKSPQISKK